MRGRRRDAVKMLTRMRRRGVPADNMAYTAAILACDRIYNGEFAITVLRRMQENQLKPDTIVYNACIKAQERSENRWEAALALADEMRANGIKPNIRTYNTIISACRKSNAWEAALGVALRLGDYGVKADLVTINTLISTMGSAAKWQAALALLRSSQQRSMNPDVITYTSMIAAASRSGAWMTALDVFREMKDTAIPPSSKAYEEVIEACDAAYQFEQAATLEKELLDSDLIYTYTGPQPGDMADDAILHAAAEQNDMLYDAHEQQQQPARRSSFNVSHWGKFLGKGTEKEINEDRSDVRGAQQTPNGRPFAFFAVYDGHGGGSTAQWLKENLAVIIDTQWDVDEPKESVRLAFRSADAKILEPRGGILGIGAERGVGGSQCGSSAATAIMYRTKDTGVLNVLTANLGNSVVFLKPKNEQMVALTALHTPYNQTEFERIQALENPNPSIPLIRERGGRLRLGGSLSLTRAFGDAYLKPNYEIPVDEDDVRYPPTVDTRRNDPLREESIDNKIQKVSDFGLRADPDITVTEMKTNDEWLLLATNGLMVTAPGDSGLTPEQVEAIVEQNKAKTPNEVCAALASEARQNGSKDDITIIFVPLGPDSYR